MLFEFTFNKKLLFLLIFPIFNQIDSIVYNIYIKKDNNLFIIFRTFLSYEFSIIFIIISRYKNKYKKGNSRSDSIEEINKNNESINVENIIDVEYKKMKNKKRIRSILLLILISTTNVCASFFNFYVGDNNVKFSRNTIGIIYEIIIFIILSYIFLKQKFYRLHYLICIIMILSLIGLFINYSVQIKDKYEYYKIFWFFLINTLLYDLNDVLLKVYLNVFFHSIYYMLFFIGSFISVLLIIYDTIAYFSNEDLSGIIIGFKNNITNIHDFFLFLCDLILQFFLYSGIMLTIYFYTPFHFTISEFISELISYYKGAIEYFVFDKKIAFNFIYSTHNIIIFSIVFLINLICSLIFNEIIILKFCRLEHYTRKYINKRGIFESMDMFNDIVSINSDEESNVAENFNKNE